MDVQSVGCVPLHCSANRLRRSAGGLLVLAAWPLNRLSRCSCVRQPAGGLVIRDRIGASNGSSFTRTGRISAACRFDFGGRSASAPPRHRRETRSCRPSPVRTALSSSPPGAASVSSNIVGGAVVGLLAQLRLILVFIAAQTGLNVYMKWMMSSMYVSSAVRGIPASFLVTGLQQLVALCMFIGFLILRLAFTKRLPKCPRVLRGRELLFVLAMAATFALNMSFNNFSLALIPLSINQVIRACMPLATAMLQLVLRRKNDTTREEFIYMLLGVGCAVLTVIAKVEGRLAAAGADFLFGVMLCLSSVFLGALDLIWKNAVKSELELSPVDAMGYMAAPAFLFLLLPAALWHHRVPDAWAAHLGASGAATGWTDMAVLSQGLALRPSIVIFIAISGVIAFGYNVITTFFAIRLSPTTTSLVGNFPTTILVSLFIMERNLPSGNWRYLMFASIIGNVAFFTAYSMAKRRKSC